MSYQHFTSLPPEEEATFIVYEQRTQEASKKARTLGLVVAAIFGFLIVVIVFSHDKPKSKMEGEDMGMLSNEKERADQRTQIQTGTAPAPSGGTAAPAPSGDTAAPAPSGDTAAPAPSGDPAPAGAPQ